MEWKHVSISKKSCERQDLHVCPTFSLYLPWRQECPEKSWSENNTTQHRHWTCNTGKIWILLLHALRCGVLLSWLMPKKVLSGRGNQLSKGPEAGARLVRLRNKKRAESGSSMNRGPGGEASKKGWHPRGPHSLWQGLWLFTLNESVSRGQIWEEEWNVLTSSAKDHFGCCVENKLKQDEATCIENALAGLERGAGGGWDPGGRWQYEEMDWIQIWLAQWRPGSYRLYGSWHVPEGSVYQGRIKQGLVRMTWTQWRNITGQDKAGCLGLRAVRGHRKQTGKNRTLNF